MHQSTPGREQILNMATFQSHFPLVVARAVFGFALDIKPIWWYPYLRSREERILQLHNHTSKSVVSSRV